MTTESEKVRVASIAERVYILPANAGSAKRRRFGIAGCILMYDSRLGTDPLASVIR